MSLVSDVASDSIGYEISHWKKNSLRDVSVSRISSDTLERHGKHGITGKNNNFD